MQQVSVLYIARHCFSNPSDGFRSSISYKHIKKASRSAALTVVEYVTLPLPSLELVVKNLHMPILESAIAKIVNGNDLSSAKKLIVKSIRDVVYVWKQSGYGITCSCFSSHVSFGIRSVSRSERVYNVT